MEIYVCTTYRINRELDSKHTSTKFFNQPDKKLGNAKKYVISFNICLVVSFKKPLHFVTLLSNYVR